MNPNQHLADALEDEQLVARTLAGERDAFRWIVERYQTLICSVAYNATGSLTQSEDLAQETFIAGWKQMAQLREPTKLRSWLCGIAHNLSKNSRQKLATEPAHVGSVLSDGDAVAAELPPSEAAIRREQEAILWQALESIPADYRQPLILFYREHRSIERVAQDLGLSEDAVRQRLSRGRKLLQREVAAFVEGALERTAPDTMFTMSVIGALPLLAGSSAAGTGAAGGVAAQWAGAGFGAKLLTVLNVVIGPLIGILAAWLGVRASIAETRSPEERRLVKRYFLTIAGGTIVFTLCSVPLNIWANANGGFNPAPMVIWLALLLAYLAGMIVLAVRLQRKQRAMLRAAGELHPKAAPRVADARRGSRTEYRSRWTLLGLPLVHVRLNPRADEAERPALGWIAIGNYAFGILFAWGGMAVGAVSGGGISVGLVSIGAVSVGFLALGGLAVGVYAMGGVAVGLMATGAFAFGWVAAEGRYAVAREFALGVHAAAMHANDAIARQFFADRPWLDLRATAGRAMFSFIWVPALVAVWHYLRQRRTSRRHGVEVSGI